MAKKKENHEEMEDTKTDPGGLNSLIFFKKSPVTAI